MITHEEFIRLQEQVLRVARSADTLAIVVAEQAKRIDQLEKELVKIREIKE